MTVKKTNAKVITLTNHNMSKHYDEPIQIPSNLTVTCTRHQKNCVYKVQLVLLLLLIGRSAANEID